MHLGLTEELGYNSLGIAKLFHIIKFKKIKIVVAI